MATRRTSHAVYDAKYHLVWTPKYRKWVLRGDVQERVEELFREIGRCHEIEIDTNEVDQDSADDTRELCAIHWKIEQFHREAKQVTGAERCQCRSARVQRNHVGCAMLVWVRLKEVAAQTGQSIYQVKFGQLSGYLIEHLKSPSVQFA